jgi:hypothetical protein
MRARAIDAAPDAGAAFGLEHGLVGTGEALAEPPSNLDEAVAAAEAHHGEKTARMLRSFGSLPDGTFVSGSPVRGATTTQPRPPR